MSNYAGTWYDKDNPTDEVVVINSNGSITINDENGATLNEMSFEISHCEDEVQINP